MSLVTNTAKAHQVLHFAKAHGRQGELVERLFTAMFAEGRHLGTDTVLAELTGNIGLDPDAVIASLASGEYRGAVDADIAEARSRGVNGVPYFLFNGVHSLSGAQPPEMFTSTLQQLSDRRSDPG